MRWNSLSRALMRTVILCIAITTPGTVRAALLTVSDFGDTGAQGQLRTLINAAGSGDTIVIPPGTIVLSGAAGDDLNLGGDLDIRFKDLTLQGAGPGQTVIDGGGVDRVFETFSATVTISGVTVRNGSVGAGEFGGGIYNNGTLTLANSTVSGNTTGFRGGGIYSQAGAVTLTNVTVSGNRAGQWGGGLANNNSPEATMVLTNVSITGNTAQSGGAIMAGGQATLTNATISGNTVTDSGGGFLSFGTLILTNATVTGNTAEFGGGLYNQTQAESRLTNVTLSGNAGTTSGGGIYTSGALTLTNVTLTGNTDVTGGGNIANPSGSALVQNTIVADSPSGNCFGPITSLGHNLDSGTTCGFSGPGDLSNTDPLLGPLQDNGGPTHTHALLAGSQGIDAGDNAVCPATDQRGFARPADGNTDGTATCDIGAFEFGAIDSLSAFVTRLYQTVLGREADPDGLAAFIAQIQQFSTVIPTVLAFFKSEEFLTQQLNDQQFLTVLYRTFLDREPDPDGLAAFLGLLQTGCRTRDTLISALSFSGEFRALVPPVPVADPRVPFLAEIFAWTLDRPPDPGGFASFLAQLQRSTALSTITGFLHSTEFTVPRKPPVEYLSALYLVFLGRPPDCDGLFSFVGVLTPDTDPQRDQLAAQFAGSGEFQALLDRVFP